MVTDKNLDPGPARENLGLVQYPGLVNHPIESLWEVLKNVFRAYPSELARNCISVGTVGSPFPRMAAGREEEARK